MHLPASRIESEPNRDRGALPLPEGRARTQPALRYRAHGCTGPRAIGLSRGFQVILSFTRRKGREQSGAKSHNSWQGRDSSGTARAKRTARPHSPGPAPRLGPRCSTSPGSGFPVLNDRTSPQSGPQDTISTSATCAARDLCPGRKRKRAGPGTPTPCSGGPRRRAPRLSPSSRASRGWRPGSAGPNFQRRAVGRAAGCGRSPDGRAARARGTMKAAGPADRRASAGTTRARPPRGRSSSAAGAPNAAAAAGHRRAARPVHANGRRPRHELFSSGAERASAARRAARPVCPPPLRSRRGDFPNFPGSAPRMRPPRRLRPRPSAPAALPPLPPILCLLSRSWHLSQRARFPAHPFAAGSGRGRGYGGPGEEGTGKQGAYGPAARRDSPGAAAVTRSRAPLFRGEVRASAVPGIPTRPPGAPGHARCG